MLFRSHAEALGRAKREPALAKRLLGEQTKSDDQELLDISYRLWTEDLTELMYPNPDAVQSVLDQRAPEIAAARTANPRDFLDDRVLRDLEASGFLRPALAAQ